MIRYRTGDISTLMPEQCVCGRTMTRMKRVRARLDDMLIVRGVNLYPGEIEGVLLNIEGLAPNYQLVLERKKALDELEVHVELTHKAAEQWGNASNEDETAIHKLKRQIQSALKDSLGVSTSVKVLNPNSLARSEGKAVRVIDNRQKTLSSKIQNPK